MKIKPTKGNLKNWIDIYVPERNQFFISKNIFNEINTSDVLVMPIDKFS